MKVLVVGSGAREDAICWALSRSNGISGLYCAPGNPGISRWAKIVPIAVDRIAELRDFALGEGIGLTVVGPEVPLALGIVDKFIEAGLPIVGPTKAAAQLESSKWFAKKVLLSANAPTAHAAVCETIADLHSKISESKLPLVLKADGLAAGKGVFICRTVEEVQQAVSKLWDELHATAVVVEEFLSGIEVSFIVATNGTDVIPLASAHDYKRIFDRDKGPNTGGMGAVSPSPRLDPASEQRVIEQVIKPVLDEMRRRGLPFSGFLYAGLMISANGDFSVLEFNVRLGDPECQAILMRLESDLLPLLTALADRDSSRELPKLDWREQPSLCVVLAASGYPEQARGNDEIEGIALAEKLNGVQVFHAGTKEHNGKLFTAGGRVLSVCALGADPHEAKALAYRAADMIQFAGRQMRRDIGL